MSAIPSYLLANNISLTSPRGVIEVADAVYVAGSLIVDENYNRISACHLSSPDRILPDLRVCRVDNKRACSELDDHVQSSSILSKPGQNKDTDNL